MNDLLNKISSYNIFNYLFPGTLFVVLADKLTSTSLQQENLLVGAFLYYFVGLVISRFGSLILEPILKKTQVLKFSSYKNFVSASKKDNKIELLSEVNNTYRTLCSMVVLLIGLKIYLLIESSFPWVLNYRYYILSFCLLIMFIFSYRKQTKYINQRIEANKE